jgi:hypothetical protein
MKSITLPNRYYKTIALIEQKNGKWKFDEQVKYLRYLYNKSGTKIKSIDPEGGPFLTVGDIISGWQIKSISSKSELTMIEVKNEKRKE